MAVPEVDAEQLKALDLDKCSLSPFWREKYSKECAKNWDLFYKRNATRFFKDRHWTTQEFSELLGETSHLEEKDAKKVIFEVGCGVGNCLYPLFESQPSWFFHCC
eukprot:Sdes_comp16737_c0_seq1m6014